MYHLSSPCFLCRNDGLHLNGCMHTAKKLWFPIICYFSLYRTRLRNRNSRHGSDDSQNDPKDKGTDAGKEGSRKTCKILGFHVSKCSVCGVLGHDTAWLCSSVSSYWRNVLPPPSGSTFLQPRQRVVTNQTTTV